MGRRAGGSGEVFWGCGRASTAAIKMWMSVRRDGGSTGGRRGSVGGPGCLRAHVHLLDWSCHFFCRGRSGRLRPRGRMTITRRQVPSLCPWLTADRTDATGADGSRKLCAFGWTANSAGNDSTAKRREPHSCANQAPARPKSGHRRAVFGGPEERSDPKPRPTHRRARLLSTTAELICRSARVRMARVGELRCPSSLCRVVRGRLRAARSRTSEVGRLPRFGKAKSRVPFLRACRTQACSSLASACLSCGLGGRAPVLGVVLGKALKPFAIVDRRRAGCCQPCYWVRSIASPAHLRGHRDRYRCPPRQARPSATPRGCRRAFSGVRRERAV